MKPKFTLDTDAIRKRFAEAIVGIRADETIAVLVPFAEGCDSLFDLVAGYEHYNEQLHDEFPTLIRPGDRCEMAIDQYSDWEPVYYMGYRGPYQKHMFAASTEAGMTTFSVYGAIRPLPEPVAEPSTCSECGDKLVKCVDLAAEIVSYYCPSCQRKNNLMTRLAAAERELAAIRAEMKGTQ